MTSTDLHHPDTRQAFRTVRRLVTAYLGLSVLTLAVAFVLRSHTDVVTPAVWIRGTIVVASAALTLLLAVRVAGGSRGAFRRLRILSAVMISDRRDHRRAGRLPGLDEDRTGPVRPRAAGCGRGDQRKAAAYAGRHALRGGHEGGHEGDRLRLRTVNWPAPPPSAAPATCAAPWRRARSASWSGTPRRRCWPTPSAGARPGSGGVDPELAAATLAAGASPLTARERDILNASRWGAGVVNRWELSAVE